MTALNILRSLTLGALILSSFHANAQESKVRWKVNSNVEKEPEEGRVFHKFVKGDAGSIVGLGLRSNTTAIGGQNQIAIDRTLVALTTDGLQEIKFDKTKILWGEGPVSIETIENFNKQFRVIASKADLETGKLLLLQQIQGPRSLTGKGAQLLAEIPFDRLGKSKDYFKPNMGIGFTTLVSVDSTKMLIQLTPDGTIHSAGCPVYAQVFDKEMKSLWWNKLTTDGNARSFKIIETRVDPAGAVWYLVKNTTNPEPKVKEELGYSFSIYRLDSAGQKAALLDLAGAEFAQDATMDMRPDGSIIVAGVYADDQTSREESVGMFQCVVDPSGKELKFDRFKLHPFDKRMEKKEEKWQNNMIIDRVLAKKDGGSFVIARKSGIETHYVADLSGKKFPKTEQVDGALHVFELTGSGDLKWYKQLDREMTNASTAPGLIVPLCFENSLLILLNDAESNIEKRKQKLPVDPQNGLKDALLVEYKADGSDKTKMVLAESRFHQLGLQATSVWKATPGLVITQGAESLGKDRIWPVVITLSGEAKK
jgi:hypothetical protein